MSATLYYRKISKKNKHLRTVWAPSSFMETLDIEFPGPPYRFSAIDIPVLRGMSAAYGKGPYKDGKNGFGELIDAIEADGEIEVWAEY